MLEQDDIVRIDAKANDVLLSAYGSIDAIQLPIDLGRILEANQIVLKLGNFEDPEISGAYEKDKRAIFVSEDEPNPRKTFTIAHELGHFFMHDNKKAEIFYRKQVLNPDKEKVKEEAEANWFAASLLMPEHFVRKYWSITQNLQEIATIFGVSQTAVYFRLKNLKLLS